LFFSEVMVFKPPNLGASGSVGGQRYKASMGMAREALTKHYVKTQA
jgi:hypothetical protein